MLVGPSAGHPLGTDALGRDILARLLDAAQLDFMIAFAVAGLALVAGCIVGAIAGFAGGLVDDVVMRFVDVMLVLPGVHPRARGHGACSATGSAT